MEYELGSITYLNNVYHDRAEDMVIERDHVNQNKAQLNKTKSIRF